MGQAASIRRDRTPHTNVCRSGFTGVSKRSLYAYSKRRSKNDEFGVQLKHTAPRKLSRVEKSTNIPICQECLYDDEEIIRKISSSNDSGILHVEWDPFTNVTFCTSLISGLSHWSLASSTHSAFNIWPRP
uniref:Uncharacterized protein n=1 Tax=Mesocestoides corti TaxID=53468 RepID=A0A5K3G235_MESCO